MVTTQIHDGMDVAQQTADIVSRVRQAIGPDPGLVSLHEPTIGEPEKRAVIDCLDSGWVSSAGPFISAFESQVAEAAGAKYAAAVVNGTAALHTALLLSGVVRDDEVLIPALTFVATANAVTYAGAIPHLVDASPVTLGIDGAALRNHLQSTAVVRDGVTVNRLTGRVIRAIVPVHVFGHLADMDLINSIATEFPMSVVEDSTESLGSHMSGSQPKLAAPLSVASFNGNKIITTGGGGMILTNDESLAARAKHLTSTAKKPHAWEFDHDFIGYNYRLPNLNAALGIAQMQRLAGFVAAKRRLAESYRQAFEGARSATFFFEPPGRQSNYWLNAILLPHDDAGRRDEIIAGMHQAGLLVRPAWKPMNQLEIYKDCPAAELPATANLYARIINLPSSPFLASKSQKHF